VEGRRKVTRRRVDCRKMEGNGIGGISTIKAGTSIALRSTSLIFHNSFSRGCSFCIRIISSVSLRSFWIPLSQPGETCFGDSALEPDIPISLNKLARTSNKGYRRTPVIGCSGDIRLNGYRGIGRKGIVGGTVRPTFP